MRKRLLVLLMCCVTAVSLVGCGSKDGKYSASDIEKRIKNNGSELVVEDTSGVRSEDIPDFLSFETADLTWGDLNQESSKVDSYGVVSVIPEKARVLRSIGYPVKATHVSGVLTEGNLDEKTVVKLAQENAVWSDVVARWVVDENKNIQADFGMETLYIDWAEVKKEINEDAVRVKTKDFDEVWYYYSDIGFLDIDIKPLNSNYCVHINMSVFEDSGNNVIYEDVEGIVNTVLSRISLE